MGTAIIIKDADFSANNIGQVSILQDLPVTAIEISANSSYAGLTFTPTINYTPSNSNHKGVTWSITSGNSYATIDAATGVVTILSGANASLITIKAISSYDNTIYATLNVNVTYKETVDVLTSIAVTGNDTVDGNGATYAVTYNPTNTSYKGVSWSITSGNSYATIDASTGVVTPTGIGSVTVKATSTHDSTIVATKTITVSNVIVQPAIYIEPNLNENFLTTFVLPTDYSKCLLETLVYPVTVNNSQLFGIGTQNSYNDSGSSGITLTGYSDGTLKCKFGNVDTGAITNANIALHTKIKVSISATEVKVNDTSVYTFTATPTFGADTYPVKIGSRNRGGAHEWSGFCRFGYIKLWNNGTLVHNLQPYNTGTDWGFEDKIDGTKYSCAAVGKSAYVAQIDA